MKLREFINYKKDCPICLKSLVISFHSKRRQKIRYEDNRFIVLFTLDSIQKGQISYKVGYSFGLDDNSFYTEFYSKDEVRFQNETPIFLMKRFKELDKNLKSYKIYKSCPDCCRYSYSTAPIIIDYKNNSIGEISVNTENIIMVQSIDEGYKVYKMLNYINAKETWLNYGKINASKHLYSNDLEFERAAEMDVPNMLKTGLIPFTNHDDTMNRLSKLIVFS